MKPMHHIGWLAALATMAAGTAVLAVDLPDPTRPPYAAGNAALNGARAAASAAAAPVGASGDAANAATGDGAPARPSGGGGDRAKAANPASHGARLSAVMMADAPGRDAAVIDGEVRYVGDKVRGAVLATISASGVTLREAGGRSVRLNLFDRPPESEASPDAQPAARKPAVAAPPAADAAFPLTSPSGAAAPGKEQP
jgi:hypothetical protein